MNHPMKEIDRFFKISESKDRKLYCIPWYSNYHCINSVALNERYFQITLASKYDIMKKPMKEIVNMLKMNKFHFVVPCEVYKDFKRQRLIGSMKSKKGNEELIIKQKFEIGI